MSNELNIESMNHLHLNSTITWDSKCNPIQLVFRIKLSHSTFDTVTVPYNTAKQARQKLYELQLNMVVKIYKITHLI